MHSIIRLVVYTLLVGGLLLGIGTFPETPARLQLQIVLFLALAAYMLVLIRQGRRVNLGIIPEALYFCACGYVAVASFLRFWAFP